MTALALLVCSTARELYDLTDALWRNGFHPARSLRYYRTKRRLQLFRFHCRQRWLRQYEDEERSPKGHGMQRHIDFGAIEASAEAFDDFGLSRRQQQLQFLDGERQHLQELDNLDDIQVIDGAEFNASFYEYADSLPKYYNDQIGELTEGVSFTFSGTIAINCERFSINFVLGNGPRDVALHINPRLPQNYIVRNTKVEETWGREEVSSALPFLLRRGDRFAIQVLVTDACYMISVNGHHFAEYAHRLPYAGVRILEVKGDVEQVSMERTRVQAYPQRLPESQARAIETRVDAHAAGADVDENDANAEAAINIPHEWCLIGAPVKPAADGSPKSVHSASDEGLTLPYYGALAPKSLFEGRCLKIEGRVRLLPHSFYINLQQGRDIWPHPLIAFHLNPRFCQSSSGAMGKAVVCRNAWYDGAWAQEERSELNTNLRPGRTFSLAIVCAAKAFEVYVNREFITEFQYHVKPELVDTVYIQGDVKLWNVSLENNPLVKGTQVRIYHNPLYAADAY